MLEKNVEEIFNKDVPEVFFDLVDMRELLSMGDTHGPCYVIFMNENPQWRTEIVSLT